MAVSDVNGSSMPENAASVYVGPRPYQFGQELYGRDREAVELSRLLISQRLVLLHSPSGAGKTSLIHAKIVPALQKRRFEIPFQSAADGSQSLPISIRVNREPRDTDPPGGNRYLLSALLSLELLRPENERRDVHELSGVSIDEYLEEAFPAASREIDHSKSEADSFRPLLLVFDQFEEMVTMDPTDELAKREFVRQLGKALQNKGRWALFAIREDYLGALEPYLPAIPTNLSATYRLDLLRAEMASTVIEEPARKANVTYDEGVVHDIVEDLRRIRVQAADGSFQYKDGIYVEPVQLQVVCQSLWRIRGGSTVITHEHLKLLGQGRGTGVDAVLAGYYANRVAEAASEEKVSERLVRNWFSKSLIGSQHVRRPVLVDEALSYGLSLHCLDVLDKAFLIRREIRSGATWYELAHDRLMDPIIEDNQLWRKAHLTTFQSQAELWEDRTRPDSLLLTGESLIEAEREAEELQAELTAYEIEFLEASQKARERRLAEEAREQELSRMKILRKAMAAGVLLLIIVSTLATVAFWQRHVANEQKQLADEQKKHAQWLAYAGFISSAQEHLWWADPILARAVLNEVNQEFQEPDFRGWEYDYIDARIKERQNTFAEHKASVIALTVLEDQQRIASAARDQDVVIWNLSDLSVQERIPIKHDGLVNCMVITPQGDQIVTGGDDHALSIWDADTKESRILGQHETSVTSLILDPVEERWFASAGRDSTFVLWDLETHTETNKIETGHQGAILCMDVSSDGEMIVTGGSDGTIQFWDKDGSPIPLNSDQEQPNLLKQSGAVTCVGISPDKGWIVSGNDSGSLNFCLLRPNIANRVIEIGHHESGVSSLAINDEGTKVATGTVDGVLKEWDIGPFVRPIEELKQLSQEQQHDLLERLKMTLDPTMDFQAHNGIITCLKYVRHDQGYEIVSGSADNSVKIWDGKPIREDPEIRVHTGPVWDVEFSPDGRWLVSASGDTTLRIIRKADWSTKLILKEHRAAVNGVAFSPDGKRIASGSADRTIIVWDVKSDNESLTAEKSFQLSGHKSPVSKVIFSPDDEGRWIFSSSFDGTLKQWDAARGTLKRTYKGHRGGITDVGITPDGKYLVSSGIDKTIKIWEVGKNNVRTLTGHTDEVWSVAISPDGNQIASGSDDKTIRIWDLPSGKSLITLKGHSAGIQSLTYSPPNGSRPLRLVSGSRDNSVRLWELNTGKDVLTLWDHDDSVWGVTFSRDGERIVSCGEDWTMKVWDTIPRTNSD